MKHILYILGFLLCSISSVKAQDTLKMHKIYRSVVYLNEKQSIIKGVFYDFDDSAILVSQSLVFKGRSAYMSDIAELNITNISRIEFRKNGSIGRGFLFGALSGLALGGFLGYMDGDSPPSQMFFSQTAEQKAVFFGIPLGIIGALIGGQIGTIKVKIPINGSIKTFKDNQDRLKKYSFRN
jgi:hypothetical protein